MIRREPEYNYVWIDDQPEPSLPLQLALLKPVGNAHGDSEIFRIAHLILTGSFDMSDKFEALRRIDEAMGENGEINEHAVEEYCRQTAIDFQG